MVRERREHKGPSVVARHRLSSYSITMPPPLILASTSRYRRALLERLGVPFTAIAPDVDEASVKARIGEPDAAAVALARAKAEAVAAEHRDAVVIGSDQIATIDGRILDKPGSAARAIEQLQSLRGRTHRLVTAVAIAHPAGLVEFVDVTSLTMRAVDDAALARYVAAEQPFDCAGSYKIEGRGIALFATISSADQTAIVGLPLLRLAQELRVLGFVIP